MEWLAVTGALIVAFKIIQWIAVEKHESKAFMFMGLVILVVILLMILFGDAGGPTGGQFDHLRAK